jgi:hypothetical protein
MLGDSMTAVFGNSHSLAIVNGIFLICDHVVHADRVILAERSPTQSSCASRSCYCHGPILGTARPCMAQRLPCGRKHNVDATFLFAIPEPRG